MPPLADLPPLALDACGVLNVAAAMALSDACEQLGRRLVVVSQAAAEVLFLEDEEDGVPVRTRVQLDGLDVVELEAAELKTYVTLAQHLDDGEAATLAAAQARDWPVGTDDRKAARVAAGLEPRVAVLSTATILRSWAQQHGLGDREVGEVLRRVERRATFIPPGSDPDADWWRRCVGAAPSA